MGGPAQGQRVDLDPSVTLLYEHAGHLCVVVVAASGQVLALYRVVGRSQNWRLRREPYEGELLALVSAELPVPGSRRDALARSAHLRHRSVILASRSAVLRSRSAAVLTRAAAVIQL
jgi:hypothetical protein